MKSLFQALYDSEINFAVSCLWDGGFDVKLGDELNGFKAESGVASWAEVENWLRQAALHYHPNSKFAQQELGDGWVPIADNVVPFPLDDKLIED